MEIEDRKAKEFFQQLKQDDRLSVPSFAGMVETVAASGERKTGHWLSLRWAAAPIAAALVLLVGSWFLFVRQEQILLLPPLPDDANHPGKLTCNCGGELPPPKNDKPSKVVRHKSSARPMQMNVLISQWRSPTDFLLKTSRQRLLNDVPRLGVPLMEIKPLEFEQKNEMEEQ